MWEVVVERVFEETTQHFAVTKYYLQELLSIYKPEFSEGAGKIIELLTKRSILVPANKFLDGSYYNGD